MIEWFGAQGVYFFIAALYVWAIYALGRLPPSSSNNGRQTSVWADLRDGITYLKSVPIVLPLLGVAMVRIILGWSYRTLMPVYAEEVLLGRPCPPERLADP